MKSTTFIAILLTLLTLLLVTGAAVIFLIQGQGAMQDQVLDLQGDIEQQERTFAELQTTAAAREMVLATSEAALETTEAELDESQALLATREAALAELEAAQEAEAATAEAEPTARDEPSTVEIVSPQPGADITTDSALQIIVVGFSLDGIERLELMVGDRSQPFEHEADGETHIIFTRGVPNLSAGTLRITATLTTSANETVQDTVRVLVRDVEPEPDSDDTEGAILAPVADSRP